MWDPETVRNDLVAHVKDAAEASKKKSTFFANSRSSKMSRPARKLSSATLNHIQECVTDKCGTALPLKKTDVKFRPQVQSKLRKMHSVLAKVLSTGTKRHSKDIGRTCNPAIVPLSSAEYDSSQLEWGREGVPLCAAGEACEAVKLVGAQGPLHVYISPSLENGEKPSDSNLCLLCLRLHSEMMCKELGALQPDGLDEVPTMLLPPFTNLVNCPGGYYDWSLGVSAQNHSVFSRQCSIVGASPLLTVNYSPLKKKWHVCQDALIWKPNKESDFGGGAQDSQH